MWQWEIKLETACRFHLEISDCGHDVRGETQSCSRSGYRLKVEMEQWHFCVNYSGHGEQGHWHEVRAHNDNVLTEHVPCTCSRPRSILSISWSPLWRSSSRFNSSWTILSYKNQRVTSVRSASVFILESIWPKRRSYKDPNGLALY